MISRLGARLGKRGRAAIYETRIRWLLYEPETGTQEDRGNGCQFRMESIERYVVERKLSLLLLPCVSDGMLACLALMVD